jgi:hypothetical protein
MLLHEHGPVAGVSAELCPSTSMAPVAPAALLGQRCRAPPPITLLPPPEASDPAPASAPLFLGVAVQLEDRRRS